MKRLSSIILAVLVMSAATHGGTITIFNTGAATPGPAPALLPDGSTDTPPYSITSGPIVQPYPAPSYVAIGTDSLPYIHNSDSLASKWISPTQTNDVNTVSPIGVYTYITTFLLPPGFSGAELAGRWLSDNGATMSLNGTLVSTIPDTNAAFQVWTPFTITSNFQVGLNTLEFDVTNDFGPTALRVEFTNAVFSTPDTGSTLGLLVAALIGLFGLNRFRSVRSA